MKIVAAILVTALISAGITFLAIPDKKGGTATPDESGLKTQNAELRKALQIAKREAQRAGKTVIIEKKVVVAGATLESPEAILEYLSQIDLSNQDQRNGNNDAHRILVRQVIRYFAELTAMGSKALPAIAGFLSKDLDKEFRENTSEIVSGNWSRGQIYLDPMFPPCLRIGLLNTVRHIGKRENGDRTAAESVLKAELNATSRALEVAYIARALEDLAKDIHKDAYLLAARELLMEPIREEGREVSYLNRQNRPLLFDLLRRNKDTTFVEHAKNQLLRDRKRTEKRDGKEIEVTVTEIDGSVLAYLTGVLGDKAMPILRNLYEKPDLGDRNRSTIRQVAARYMGVSEDANIIVNSRMNEGFQLLATVGDKQKENRGRGLNTINYYLSKMGEGKNVPIEVIQSRQQYLSTLRAQTQDKEVLVWMDRTQQRLNDMSDPEKAKKLDSRFDSKRKPAQKRSKR
jgi:hypothetical protein